MKQLNKYIALLITGSLSALVSCNDFLDLAPLDEVTPNVFFNNESDLASYAIKQYSFPSHGDFSAGRWLEDNNTDNQAGAGYDNRWVPGELRVKESIERKDDPWNFDKIRNLNYFIETVVPRWQAKGINGVETNIRHYIGEVYFLRAFQYLNKLETFGDFPIVRTTLPDEMGTLTEASHRRPRNEVARFIISDLDSAIMLLNDNPAGGKNRITRNAALLLKSRTGLFEASWEMYHKGTALVPGGSGWPGANKEYLKGYSIDIDSEVNYFLDQSMKASAELADNISLEINNDGRKMDNPYYAQFVDVNMESYKEVLLWRAYSVQYDQKHSTGYYLPRSGGNSGFTRSLMEGFLCDDGLPIYASQRYQGDDSIATVKANRDDRLKLFLKEPGELLTDMPGGQDFCGYPPILLKPEERSATGYCLRKGMTHTYQEGGMRSVEGCVVYRATEAYLNYIEASCLKNGGNSIDSKASGYWKALRQRAKLPEDYMATVNATDLSKEKDWAVYSAGKQVTPLLFNIRRERRCELIQEGFRMNDLKRWRALDQVKDAQIEGFKLWGPMQKWYDDASGKSTLVPEGSTAGTPNVSSPTNSQYLRPYQIVKNSNLAYGGYNWCEAHYLTPIAIQHLRITATNPDEPATSVIYQNPGWPEKANAGAIGY